MEYPIGVEMMPDYLAYELGRAANKLLAQMMLVKPGENVVVTADTSTDSRVTNALMTAAYTLGATPILVYCATSDKSYAEPPAPLGNTISVADVWVELSYSSIMLCKSWQKAIDYGCRYINLTGMDTTMLCNLVGKVDVNNVVKLGETLKAKMEASDKIEITSKSGTELTAYNHGRKVRHSGQLATHNGYPYMMCGQISWCPIEETINGTLVFDEAIFPPTNIGILNEPVKLTLKDGIVVSIEGGKEADIYREWFASFDDPNMYRLAHYSMGFNPGSTKATGRIVEDERIFGCMEFGIGSQGKMIMGSYWKAASHTDGVLGKPTIILDGKVLEEDGKYVDPDIVTICREMNIRGY